jgi:hypothetical protein
MAGLAVEHIIGAIAVGIGATLVMDLWNLFLRRAFSIASLNYCLLGRWVRHLSEGTLRHASISAAPPRPHECTVGWVAHYTIGVVLAVGFILQPAFGLGMAASRTPNPARARLKSLATHSVFGVGLYLSALAVSYLL